MAEKEQPNTKSWWPLGKKAEIPVTIPAVPHLEWKDITELIAQTDRAIKQVSNGFRLYCRKTVEYFPDDTIVETVKELDSPEIVRTEYNRNRTVRNRQVYNETAPMSTVGGHPHHVEKHEEYISPDGIEKQTLINVYSSGKGTAYNMAGGYTGKSARQPDGSRIQMWYDDENRLFEIRYLDEKGQYHRDHAPAHVKFDHDREQTRVFYYQHGMLHNEEGPAIQEFQYQELAISDFYLQGQKYPSVTEWYVEKSRQAK